MRFNKLSIFGLGPKYKNPDSDCDDYGHKNQVVKILRDGIKRHIRGDSDHVHVSSVCQDKDSRLHVRWAEMYLLQTVQF